MPVRDELGELLGRIPMFSACSRAELRSIAKTAAPVTIRAGRPIVTEGEVGHEFFVIVEGKANVVRGGTHVADLGPGAYFGELSILDRAPRNATVVAETDIEALVLSERELDAVLAASPTVTKSLLQGLARRVHQLDAQQVG